MNSNTNNRKMFHGRCFNQDSWASKPVNSGQSYVLGGEDKTMTVFYDKRVRNGDEVASPFEKFLQVLWEGSAGEELFIQRWAGANFFYMDIVQLANDHSLITRVIKLITAIPTWPYALHLSAHTHTHKHFYSL